MGCWPVVMASDEEHRSTRAEGLSPANTPAGTNDLHIVSGQHAHQAAMEIRAKLLADNLPLPPWLVKFRVQVLRDGLTLPIIHKVAGKLQGAAQSVKPLTLSQTMQLLITKEAEWRTERGTDGSSWRTELLREVYDESGKSSITALGLP